MIEIRCGKCGNEHSTTYPTCPVCDDVIYGKKCSCSRYRNSLGVIFGPISSKNPDCPIHGKPAGRRTGKFTKKSLVPRKRKIKK